MPGIRIKWLSDDTDAIRASKAVKESLEDVADAADDSSDDMSRGFREAARDADDSADKIRKSYKTTYRDVEAAADDAADSARRANRRMSEQSKEAGQEIRQNLGEGIANAARGDFESLADTIGDTFGGAVAGIGGIATAGVAAAGALGVGALVAAFSLAEEERKKLEERAADLSNAYITAGSNVLDAMSVVSRTNEILTSTDDETKSNLKDLTQALGDRSTAARALAGDQNALAVANSLVKDTDEEYLSLTQRQTQGYTNLSEAEQQRLEDLQLLRKEVFELNEVTGQAEANFQDSQKALTDLIANAEGATKQVDELGNAVYTLPDGTQILIDAKTGQATTDVSNFKGDLATIPGQVVTNFRVTADTSPAWAAIDALRRRGEQGITVNVRPGQGRFWE